MKIKCVLQKIEVLMVRKLCLNVTRKKEVKNEDKMCVAETIEMLLICKLCLNMTKKNRKKEVNRNEKKCYRRDRNVNGYVGYVFRY